MSTSPAAGPARPGPLPDPVMRLFGELGSWAPGGPLTDGSGEVTALIGLTQLDELLVTLGGDGLRSLIAVLRHAVPTRTPAGTIRMELVGFSGSWLQEHVPGLSRNAAYRSAAALQEAGLLNVTSLEGARGAAGKQRAVLSRRLGEASGLEDLPGPTKRGRRSPGLALYAKVGNRGSDGFPLSGKPGNSPENLQVSAVSRDRETVDLELSTPLVVKEVVKTSTTEPLGPVSTALRAAEPGPSNPVAPAILGGAPNLFALQRALHRIEQQHPEATAAHLRRLLSPQAGPAARLVVALQLPGEHPASTKLAQWLAGLLGVDLLEMRNEPGSVGALISALRARRITVPALAPELLVLRLLTTVTAGLDSQVKSWTAWLASGLKKDPVEWAETPTATAVAKICAAIWAETLTGDVLLPITAVTSPRGWAAPTASEVAPHSPGQKVELDAPNGEQDAEPVDLTQLAIAVADHPYYASWGAERVSSMPRLARELIAMYASNQAS